MMTKHHTHASEREPSSGSGSRSVQIQLPGKFNAYETEAVRTYPCGDNAGQRE